MTTVLDLMLETFTHEATVLRARVADLERDVAIYREIATVGIHQLHAMTQQRDHLRDRLQRLVDELRALRAHHRRAA